METLNGLIILRGVSGSGKSTLATRLQAWYRSQYSEELAVIEIDQFFINADGQYIYEPERMGDAIDDCYRRLTDALTRRGRAVLANTHTRSVEVEAGVEIANRLSIPSAIVHVQGEFENIHGVPAERLEQQRERWEIITGEYHVPVTEDNDGLDILIDIWHQTVDSKGDTHVQY